MEVDVGVKLHELESLNQLSRDGSNNDLTAAADQLDQIGSDHIPAINLRSGSQLRDLLLNEVINLIGDARAEVRFDTDKIDAAVRLLEITKRLHNTGVYLVKKPLSNHLKATPLNQHQLNHYLKREIDRLQA